VCFVQTSQRRNQLASRGLNVLKQLVHMGAMHYRILHRHRASDVIRTALVSHAGSASLTRVVKNFQEKVLCIQRLVRSMFKVREAKLSTWVRQWDKLETEILLEEYEHEPQVVAYREGKGARPLQLVIAYNQKRTLLEAHMREYTHKVRL
jgi:hypothetical protein